MAEKIAYVTGATGSVGRNIVNVLLGDNWRVTILHRRSSDLSRLRELKVGFQEVDLHNLESVRKSIPSGVSAIFHAAGNTSHWSVEADVQWKDNVLATRNLVEASIEKNVGRFIFTSTGATQKYQHLDEAFAENIGSSYVRTKRLSEIEVYKGIERGLDAVILCPIIVLGPYDYNSYSQIFQNLKKHPVIFSFPGHIVFCHAHDVAVAHLRAYEGGRCGETYILGGTRATWKTSFEIIAKTMGIKKKVYVIPKSILLALSWLMTEVSLVTRKKPLITPELVRLLEDSPDVPLNQRRKSKLELGYESQSLDKMAKDCHDWLADEGRLL